MDNYLDLIEPYFGKIVIWEGEEKYRSTLAAIPRDLLLLAAAHLCYSEIGNGGILQLFLNSTGTVVPEGIEGFRALGMPQTAEFVEQAANILGTPYPRDRAQRQDALLRATKTTLEDFARLLEQHKHPFIAHLKAAEPLDLEGISERMYAMCEMENGGFETEADRFAKRIQAAQ
jgi:hypothetical protein